MVSKRLKREGVLVTRDKTIDTALDNLGVSWLHRDSGCWYSPSTDQVNIPKDYRFFDTETQTATQAYYVVVFHELVHWTKRRVLRKSFHSNGFRGVYAAEELVAELGALTLMKCFGKDVRDPARHANYFQDWRDLLPEGERDAAVAYAKKEAARAVKFILHRGKLMTDDARPTRRHAADAPGADLRGNAAGENRVHDALEHRARAPGEESDGEVERAFRSVVLSAEERQEDERLRYGPLKARVARQKAAVRQAERATIGIKRANAFIGQALLKEKIE